MTINITDYMTEEDKNIIHDLNDSVPLDVIVQRYGRNFILHYDFYMRFVSSSEFDEQEFL